MSKWVPAVAVVGLVCLMVIPAPGVLGVVIGAGCVLAIALSAIMFLLDRLATRLIALGQRIRSSLFSQDKRAVHKHSGTARTVVGKRRATPSPTT